MPETHREKWNERYKEEDFWKTKGPSEFLKKWQPKLPPGKALVPGCGTGRNAVFLASKNYSVDAIDYSDEGLKIARDRAQKKEVEVNWIHSNISEYEFPENEYDVVAISFFHPQEKLSSIKKSLKSGGFFIYEHHITSNEPIERGPENYQFRYQPNELLARFSDFQILSYREGIEADEEGRKSAIARLSARRTDNFDDNMPEIEET